MRRRVVALEGIAGPQELVQVDTFFDVPRGRMKLREFGDGSAELIGYERPDVSGPKMSTYTRVSVPDAEAIRHLFSRAFGVRTTVRKRRTVFLLGQTRIHLDEVESLGSFIELEVVLRDGQTAEQGEQIAERLLEALSVSPDDLISGAYADLIAS